jgi:hypothetical protein
VSNSLTWDNEKSEIMRRINIGILCLILTGISVALSAQESKRALKQGESVTAAISKNESHRYQLQMDKDQFALLKIMQSPGII